MSNARRPWVRAGRSLWGGLALVVLVLLGLSSLLSARAEEGAEVDARQRAERTAAVLFEAVSPRLASDDIVGSERRDLLEVVRARILNDDRVARVRIWSPGGGLIFSSATRDDASEVIAEGHLQFSQAAGGVPASVVVEATETAGPLLQTFVPLRAPDGTAPYAVAEIDQRYGAIQAEANRIWGPARIVLVVALGVVVVLFLLSFVGRRGARTAGEHVPMRDDREVREMQEHARAAEPVAVLPAEPVAPPAGSVALPAEPVGALPAEPVAPPALERPADAERVPANVPTSQVPPNVLARVDELETRLRAETAERERVAGEAQGFRSALEAKETELEHARQAAATSAAEVARSADQLANANRRATDAEKRARGSEKQAADAEKRARGAEKQAAEAEKRAGKAERAKRDDVAKSAADLRSAQLETNAVKQKLAEVEASLADAEARLADRKRAAPETGRERAASETGAAGLEVELLRAERDVATADLARARQELEKMRAELDDARARVAETEAPRDEIT